MRNGGNYLSKKPNWTFSWTVTSKLAPSLVYHGLTKPCYLLPFKWPIFRETLLPSSGNVVIAVRS